MMTRASTALLLLAPLASPGQVPFTTEQLRGFYTERICGTVFTDRCRAASTRTGLRKNCHPVHPGEMTNLLRISLHAFAVTSFW